MATPPLQADDDCAICQELITAIDPIGDVAWFAQTGCTHGAKFHRNCLLQWFAHCSRANIRHHCPLCRRELQAVGEVLLPFPQAQSPLALGLARLTNPLNDMTRHTILVERGMDGLRTYLMRLVPGGNAFCWQCGALPREHHLQQSNFGCNHMQHFYCHYNRRHDWEQDSLSIFGEEFKEDGPVGYVDHTPIECPDCHLAVPIPAGQSESKKKRRRVAACAFSVARKLFEKDPRDRHDDDENNARPSTPEGQIK